MEDLVGATPDNLEATGTRSSVGGAPAAATIWDQAGGARVTKRGRAKATTPTVNLSPLRGEFATGPVDLQQSSDQANLLAVAAGQSKEQEYVRQNTGFMDAFRASYDNEMRPLVNAISRMGDTPLGVDPRDEAWLKESRADWKKTFAGYSSEERDNLLEAVNKKDYDRRVEQIKMQRGNAETLEAAGTGNMLATGLLAAVANPVNIAAAVAVGGGLAATGKASWQLASQGRKVAAIGSDIAENVVGNVAVEGFMDAMGEHRSVADYGLSAAFGVLPSAIAGPFIYREAMQATANKIQSGVIAKRMEVYQEARRTLGDDAEPAALVKEMARIETRQLSEVRSSSMRAAPEADRLPAPDLDERVKELALEDDFNDNIMARFSQRVENTAQDITDLGSSAGAKKIHEVDPAITKEFFQKKENARGTLLSPSVADDPFYQQLHKSAAHLVDQFLPNHRIIVTGVNPQESLKLNGEMIQLHGDKTFVIRVSKSLGDLAPMTMVHELGHAIERAYLKSAPKDVQDGVEKLFMEWQANYHQRGLAETAQMQRGPIGRFARLPDTGERVDGGKSLSDVVTESSGAKFSAYYKSKPEFMAEQFNKYIEAGARGIGHAAKNVSIPQQVIEMAKKLFKQLVELFSKADEKGMLGTDARFEAFMDNVLTRVREGNANPQGTMTRDTLDVGSVAHDVAMRNGLDLMPQRTPRERAEFKAAVDMYTKAEEWVRNNPFDEQSMKDLLGNNSTFNVALPSTILASSNNPVAKMIAGTLLEQATGATGRRRTAAIAKKMLEQSFVGDSIHQYDELFGAWLKQEGGSVIKEHFNPEFRERFNKAVAAEQDARLRDVQINSDPLVMNAVDMIEQSYERMRIAQVENKTVGWARLPESSRGYMPHVLAAGRMQELSPAEERQFVNILSKQFQQIEGWDVGFSDELARAYVGHARINARGGHEIPANVHNPAAADMVQGALQAMGMSKDEVAAAMGRYAAGGASHTKKRLHLDLNAEYMGDDGVSRKLVDLFVTDQVSLLRNYAQRVSGEVALMQHGVVGSQGLALMRNALTFGGAGQATPREMQAFDQIAAEFLGRPFGEARSKGLDRLLTTTAMVRLGGVGFTQIGETINAVFSLGVKHTLDSVVAMPRIRAEVAAISRGEKVENGVLGSLEQWGGGGEFGLEGYKMVSRYDNPEASHETYSRADITWVDRALRTGAHAANTLSMHRMSSAVQRRGIAEQVTLKAIRYIREGGEDKALADMGFTPDVITALKKDLPNMVKYDAQGRVQEFDITQATDGIAADAFVQSVHRGTNQIIQDSFIGEKGKWVHSDLGRLLSQFRNFPLVALEKQWGRNKLNHGVAGALGILVASTALVTPIVMARIAFNSIGRPDREEYLEKNLDPANLARMSLNYVGSSGFLGDFADLLGPALCENRSGGQGFVGKVVPAAGYLNDVYSTATDPDAHKIAKLLPFSRTPFLLPAVNALKED